MHSVSFVSDLKIEFLILSLIYKVCSQFSQQPLDGFECNFSTAILVHCDRV